VEKRNEARKLTYESRKKMYDELLQPFIDSMIKAQRNQQLDIDKLTKQMTEVGIKLAIYGSDKVIAAYEKFRSLGQKKPENPYQILVEFGKLIVTIRKDSGFPDTEVNIEKVLRMFIIDYDINKDKIESLLK